MAKQTAKPTPKKKTPKQIIDLAANRAAEEATQEFDAEFDETEIVEPQFEAPTIEAAQSVDVFEEGHRRAIALNDSVRYTVHKDSQFLCVKDYPYSFEKLQKDFGAGYYRIFAKRRSNGHLLKQQSEMVGDPYAGREEEVETASSANDNLNMVAFLAQQQERADTRARESAKTQEGGLATVMQTVMSSQQESNKLMMTMFMEQAKQTQSMMMALMQKPAGPDPLMTLVTTLLTQKPATPPPDQGMKWTEVLKLISDAETRAENRATKNYEMIEKKADQIADMKVEAMNAGEGEEKPTSFLGSLAPVLMQMMQQNQGQPTGEQIAAQRMEEERRRIGGPSMNQDFIDAQNMRPAISASRPELVRRTQPQRPVRPGPAQTSPVQRPVVDPRTAPAGASTSPGPVNAAPPVVLTPEEQERNRKRAKDQIFEFCSLDIGKAMMERVDASIAAEGILQKLAIEGIPRQTVAKLYTVEDFFGYADQYGITAMSPEVKPWLKEFHAAIQKAAGLSESKPAPIESVSAEPVRDEPAAPSPVQPEVSVQPHDPRAARSSDRASGAEHAVQPVQPNTKPSTQASNGKPGTNGKHPPRVAAKRDKPDTRKPGTQSRKPSQNI